MPRFVAARALPVWLACAAAGSASLAAISASIAPSALAQAQSSPVDGFPNGVGKAPLLRVCGACHGVDTIVQTLRTRQEWSDILDEMARLGAEATDREFEQIAAYLVKFYSPIRINKATAKELENTLDVSPEAAEAIVAYRQEKGPFKTVDDLSRVPGLDAAKVEARRARLVFSS